MLQHKTPGNCSAPGTMLLLGCVLIGLLLQGTGERDALRAQTQLDSLSVRLEAEDNQKAVVACGFGRVLVERGHPAETD